MNRRMPATLIEVLAQTIDHLRGGQSAPLRRRLEADEHGAAIGVPPPGPPPPPSTDPMPATAGSAITMSASCCCKPEHRLERDVGGCPRRADHKAAVVGREISLRGLDIERHRQRDGREEHHQRQERETQHRAAASAHRTRRCATSEPSTTRSNQVALLEVVALM